MVKWSGQLPFVFTSVLKIFVSTSVIICCGQVQGSMNRSVYYKLIVVSLWTECNHRFSRILYRDQLEYKVLWFEQLSITVQVPWWWNYPDSFHWSSHLSWRYSSVHRYNYLLRLRYPVSMNRSVYCNWTSSFRAECNHRFSRILYRDQLNTKRFDSNNYRSPSRSSWW